MADLNDLQRKLQSLARDIPVLTARIIEVEGLNFIQENFQAQGFKDTGIDKWKPRATTDKNGRDITRYRTSRVGPKGKLNRYGSKNKDRAILTGHNTGGDKLRNSFSTSRTPNAIRFRTYKEYAQRHNEGINMPKRQFMGPSRHLTSKIKAKLTQVLIKRFNQ